MLPMCPDDDDQKYLRKLFMADLIQWISPRDKDDSQGTNRMHRHIVAVAAQQVNK